MYQMMCYPRPGSLQKVSQSVCCYIHNTTLLLKAPSKTNPRVHHWRAGEQTSRVPGAKHHRTTGRNKGLTGLLQGQPSGTMCLVEEVRRTRCMVSFTDSASKAHFVDRKQARGRLRLEVGVRTSRRCVCGVFLGKAMPEIGWWRWLCRSVHSV